jgi:hypothetical protein
MAAPWTQAAASHPALAARTSESKNGLKCLEPRGIAFIEKRVLSVPLAVVLALNDAVPRPHDWTLRASWRLGFEKRPRH